MSSKLKRSLEHHPRSVFPPKHRVVIMECFMMLDIDDQEASNVVRSDKFDEQLVAEIVAKKQTTNALIAAQHMRTLCIARGIMQPPVLSVGQRVKLAVARLIKCLFGKKEHIIPASTEQSVR